MYTGWSSYITEHDHFWVMRRLGLSQGVLPDDIVFELVMLLLSGLAGPEVFIPSALWVDLGGRRLMTQGWPRWCGLSTREESCPITWHWGDSYDCRWCETFEWLWGWWLVRCRPEDIFGWLGGWGTNGRDSWMTRRMRQNLDKDDMRLLEYDDSRGMNDRDSLMTWKMTNHEEKESCRFLWCRKVM